MERRENSRFDLQCLCATEKTFKFYVKEKNSAKAVNEDYVKITPCVQFVPRAHCFSQPTEPENS